MKGYNPYGKISRAFSDTKGTVGPYYPGDASAVPTSGVTYTVVQNDLIVYCEGGTVSAIEIFDQNGDVCEDDLATSLAGKYLPLGFKIRFTYTVVPTVKVYGV